jgi:GTPase SAR1 family protein
MHHAEFMVKHFKIITSKITSVAYAVVILLAGLRIFLFCKMSDLKFIEELIEKYRHFDISSISWRYLSESIVLFENHISYLESVIESEAFSNLSETFQSSVKMMRIKFRVDIRWIKEKIENCPNADLLIENSDDEVER